MKKGKLILTLALATAFFGCTNGDDYGTPDLTTECHSKTANVDILTGVVTPASLVGQNATLWTDSATGAEDILEAYVTSSDEGGNFYKSISMVAFDSNGDEYGFSVPVDQYNLYTMYEPGRKVYVKLNGLYYGESIISGNFNGVLVGGLNGTQVGRISINEFPNFLLRSCESKTEEELLHTNVSFADAKSNEYLNKLIEFDEVQFADAFVGKTYYDPSNTAGSGTNNLLTDRDGNTLIVRVSAFSNFVSEKIPGGNGKVRGVMTKYNNDYQFMIRTVNDVQLTNDRYIPQTFFEDGFENDWTIWTKYSVTGAQEWTWGTNGYGNPDNYAKMSGYSGGNNVNDDWLISPAVDLSTATEAALSFDTAKNYTGNDLEIYVSSNYDGSSAPSTATWTQVTGNLSTGSWNWIGSGNIDVTSYVGGNLYVAFRYTSTSSASSTWEVDNVRVTGF
ncbi:DUF5689 domain-containing protein [Flavobacterium sp.]|uniref:DUF5689 domain-containing protein n=1 Tax=Flavobacterium sp. TaxID=239 RepID=UPI003526F944